MMNHHHRPSPPQATAVVISKRHLFFISLILSIFLFSFQTAAKTIVYSLASFVDTHPSIQTHFHIHQLQNPLTSDQQLFGHPPPQPNATPLTLNRTRVSDSLHFGLKQEIESSTWSYIFHASLYLFVFNGFIVTQSWAHGIVFVLIVYHMLKADHNQSSLIMILRKGAYLGVRRLACFFTIRWMIRAVSMQSAKLVFGYIEDRCKYFVILNFIPFSHTLSWVEGFDFVFDEYSGFPISWLLLEMLVSLAFHAIVFVAMMDSRNTIPEVISEGFRLLSVRERVAKHLKVTEYFVSRLVVAVILKEVFGVLFASFLQSLVEGYFMVTWMMYYFEVKSMDANSRGLPFGKREFEAMLQDV